MERGRKTCLLSLEDMIPRPRKGIFVRENNKIFFTKNTIEKKGKKGVLYSYIK